MDKLQTPVLVFTALVITAIARFVGSRGSVLLIMGAFSLPVLAEPPAGYPFLSFDKAMQQAQTQNKLLFVYFGRYGCGYCDKTNKEAFSDPQVREAYIKHYVLAYVDSESGKRIRLPSGERVTEREIVTRYNAFVTPILSFMTAEGKQLMRLVGVQGSKDLREADQKVQALLTRQAKP